jgi:hypothetical protein
MAGLLAYINIPSKSLTATTPTTVAFLTAPANQRVKVLAYGFYFDGISNVAQPVELKIGACTGGTLTAGSAVKVEPELTETIQSVVGVAASVEPTYTAYKTFTVHPQLGYEYLAPPGQEDYIKGGTQWGIQANAPAGVNIRGYVKFEE